MQNNYSHDGEFWAARFREFQQVEFAKYIFDTEVVHIKIKGRDKLLQATQEELDDSLHKFNSNPHEVVTYFLKKNGILVYYQDTLVGFFDIQAYSNYIKETSTEEAIRRISKFI